jgi:hypothetical protein
MVFSTVQISFSMHAPTFSLFVLPSNYGDNVKSWKSLSSFVLEPFWSETSSNFWHWLMFWRMSHYLDKFFIFICVSNILFLVANSQPAPQPSLRSTALSALAKKPGLKDEQKPLMNGR